MFEESIKYGEYGEHTVWNMLMNRAEVRSVVDVRKDKKFQEQDIDFLVENNKRQFTAVEVKTDFKAQETGNIVYELTTDGNVGCFEKTKAQYILYFVPKARVCYMISVKCLREYVREQKFNVVDMGDASTGYLIPIEDLKQANVIKNVYPEVF